MKGSSERPVAFLSSELKAYQADVDWTWRVTGCEVFFVVVWPETWRPALSPRFVSPVFRHQECSSFSLFAFFLITIYTSLFLSFHLHMYHESILCFDYSLHRVCATLAETCAVVLESCRPRSRLCAWPSCYKKPGELRGSMRAAPRKFDKGNQRYMKDHEGLSTYFTKKLHDVWCFSSSFLSRRTDLLWQHFGKHSCLTSS